MKTQSKVAIVIIIASVMVLGLFLHVASLDENDWIGIKQHTYPPTVHVTRDDQDTIWIRWYGGWDNQFIDHIQVCTSVGPCQKYVKPQPGHYITIPMAGDAPVDVEVYGWDLAGRYYHMISNVTV